MLSCIPFLVVLLAVGAAADSLRAPVVIAQGGSTCTLPDQTLEAFQTAIDEGADFISLHVVTTKDGVLIARPSVTLDANTNIKDVRALNGYTTTKSLWDGRKKSGYFAADLTLEEVKSLYAIQTFQSRDNSYDTRYRVPTLKEVLNLVRVAEAAGKQVGVAIHTLEPKYHANLGHPLAPAVMAALAEAGFDKSNFAKRIKLQSYKMPVLEEFRREMDKAEIPPHASLVLLVACSGRTPIISDEELDEFARIGHALAPEKELLEELSYASECGSLISPPCWKTGQYCTGKLKDPYTRELKAKPTALLQRAHNRSLAVYPYTFRNEGRYMAVDFAADLQQELDYFAGPQGMGVDGFYIDCTRTSNEWLLARNIQLRDTPSKLAEAAEESLAAGMAAAARAADAATIRARKADAGGGSGAAQVPAWSFALVVAIVALAAVVAGLIYMRSQRRSSNTQYKAWKDEGFSRRGSSYAGSIGPVAGTSSAGPSLHSDTVLPVSTGAAWGLQKSQLR